MVLEQQGLEQLGMVEPAKEGRKAEQQDGEKEQQREEEEADEKQEPGEREDGASGKGGKPSRRLSSSWTST